MRKTVLRKVTILLAVVFTIAALIFASARYFTDESRLLRAREQQAEDNHNH